MAAVLPSLPLPTTPTPTIRANPIRAPNKDKTYVVAKLTPRTNPFPRTTCKRASGNPVYGIQGVGDAHRTSGEVDVYREQ